VLEKVKPAVATVDSRLDADPVLSQTVGERTAANRRYIAEVGHANALQSVQQIRERSPLLREQMERGEILLVSAIYDVDSGQVTFDLNK
jgi:carbonic anhydrase